MSDPYQSQRDELAVLKRSCNDIHGRASFRFETSDDTDVPEHFENDVHLLDFMVVCCLSPSRYFN